ncbi:MAG: hypothetical protein ACJAZO_005127 [Myxococcota bacterium]|jgi:hypothetical protein
MTLTRNTALSTLAVARMSLTDCFLFTGEKDSGETTETYQTEERSDDTAPVLLDFSVNTSTAIDIDQSALTAVLKDLDGIEDRIGGTLKAVVARRMACSRRHHPKGPTN